MSTEIELHRPQAELGVQMEYARAVSSGSLLPQSYRDNPANVLIAMGLGEAMGLSPAESLYRIDVIQGKPTASAELMAANVRKAGHKLRVSIDETAMSVTATVIRADDPEFPFVVTRDQEWARSMGLLTKDNYKKQPLTMLQWRAISGVARLACPEALYGVSWTPDEVQDFPRNGASSPLASALETPVGPARASTDADASEGPAPSEPADPSDGEPTPITKRTRGQLFALFAQKGIAEEDQLSGVNHLTGSTYTSRADISEDDALAVIEVLKGRPDVDVPMGEDES